jgi:LysM repeat protein
MNGKKFFSLLMVFSLLVSLSLFFMPAVARADNDKTNPSESGGNSKVIVVGLQPGESVYTYVGEFPMVSAVTNAAPPGNFASKIDSPTGGQIETMVPVGKTTSVYVANSATNAYRLIGVVSPGSTWPDTILNAQQTIQLAFTPAGPQVGNAPIISNRGLASPMTPAQPQSAAPQSSMPSSPASSSTSDFSNFTQSYTVIAGDTLSALAKKFGATTSDLAAANSISDPNLIRVGQQLKVPASSMQPQQPSMQQPSMQPQQPSTGSPSSGY